MTMARRSQAPETRVCRVATCCACALRVITSTVADINGGSKGVARTGGGVAGRRAGKVLPVSASAPFKPSETTLFDVRVVSEFGKEKSIGASEGEVSGVANSASSGAVAGVVNAGVPSGAVAGVVNDGATSGDVAGVVYAAGAPGLTPGA